MCRFGDWVWCLGWYKTVFAGIWFWAGFLWLERVCLVWLGLVVACNLRLFGFGIWSACVILGLWFLSIMVVWWILVRVEFGAAVGQNFEIWCFGGFFFYG